ncbi:MAG: hypothetical protein MJK04_07470, partial [Psychrosphaera sp.]|nr:hypothetical protein [Psychrosphaera sp.]
LTAELDIYHISQGLVQATGEEQLNRDAALAYGPMRVMGQEHDNITAHIIDVPLDQLTSFGQPIVDALCTKSLPFMLALRKNRVWQPLVSQQQTLKPVVWVRRWPKSWRKNIKPIWCCARVQTGKTTAC